MKIVLASRNKKKIHELQTLLSEHIPDVEVLSLDEVGLHDEIVENGDTFADNALIKATYAATSGYIGVGDDSGLTVDALDGEPGVYSARYAEIKGYGDNHDDNLNNDVLLKNLEGVENRDAAFVCGIACVFPDGSAPISVEGRCEGVILTERHGESGFGYDPLFWVAQFNKTFAEMSESEKNSVSHRGRAVRALALALKNRV